MSNPLTTFMLNVIWMHIRSDDKPALFRIQYSKTTFATQTIWLWWWTKWKKKKNWYVCVLLYLRSICLVFGPVHALNWIILFGRIFCDKFPFKLNFPFYNVCVYMCVCRLEGIKHQYMTNKQSKQCRCSKIDWQGSRRNPTSTLNHCIRSSNAKQILKRRKNATNTKYKLQDKHNRY